ncbi:MAG: hypothetical protein M0R22_04255 [Dehalococcoidia bacterium]|nr:hypothetical protein [Dehalococcoidia bacterium]
MTETHNPSVTMVTADLAFPAEDLEKTYYRIGIKGASMAVAKSALQKAIRRGDAAVATYWAAILLGSHKIANLFNRLLTIASEDIGPADDSALRAVLDGYQWYAGLRQSTYGGRGEWKRMRNIAGIRSTVDGLVRMLCAAPKSRACDHGCIGIVGPIFDGTEPLLHDDWPVVMARGVAIRDPVLALESLAKALKTDRAYLESVLSYLDRKGCGTAVASAKAIMSTKDRKARPPFMPLVHGLFTAMHMGSDHGAAPIHDSAAVDTLYRRLLGVELLHTPPGYAIDMHVLGVSRGSVRSFIEAEHAALVPRVDPATVGFPETDLYDKARLVGAAVREKSKLEARKRQ